MPENGEVQTLELVFNFSKSSILRKSFYLFFFYYIYSSFPFLIGKNVSWHGSPPRTFIIRVHFGRKRSPCLFLNFKFKFSRLFSFQTSRFARTGSPWFTGWARARWWTSFATWWRTRPVSTSSGRSTIPQISYGSRRQGKIILFF